MKDLYSYLQESTKYATGVIWLMDDVLSTIAGDNDTYSARYCPSIKNFDKFMDDNERELIDSLREIFSKAERSDKIKFTKDEKKLVVRIAVFMYKNAYTLTAEISNLYRWALDL